MTSSARPCRSTSASGNGTAGGKPAASTITVGGLPGTGTSTLCKVLEQILDLPYVYAGQIFRQQAVDSGYTLAEFNELAQRDPSVDRALDDRQLELLRGGGLILEGRLAGWLAHRHGIPAHKVWVVCSEPERVRRLVARDGGNPDDQRQAMRDRVDRESDRYSRYYGFDPDDLSIYDLVLDSTEAAPEELAGAVVQSVEARPREG